MTAAWIIERSSDAVRNHWDKYRSGWRRWEFREGLSSDRRKEFGFELREVGPSSVFEVVRGLDPLDDYFHPPNRELSFALRSGHLVATGVSPSRASPSPIPRLAWRGPFPITERKTCHDAIYAVDDDVDEDRDDEVLFDEIRVSTAWTGVWSTSLLGWAVPIWPSFVRWNYLILSGRIGTDEPIAAA